MVALAAATCACSDSAPAKSSTAAATDATGDSSSADSGADHAPVADGNAPTDSTAGSTTDSNSAGTDAKAADGQADATAIDTTQPAVDAQGGVNGLFESQEWFLGVQAAPFGDLKLPFKMTVVATGDIEKGGVILAMQLRAMSADLTYTSEPIATLQNVPIAAGGAFSLQFDNMVLPAKAAPTGSEVPLNMVLKGKIASKSVFCGEIEGTVPQFEVSLKGSKFKAVPYGQQKSPYESSCEGTQVKLYKPIDKCPVLLPGENTMTSAERSRTFIVQLPKQATSTAGLPVIFLFHGVDGTPEGMIDTSGLLPEQAKDKPFVIVSARSERDAKGKALLKTDWYYASPFYDMDNPDLVFFDDMHKCVGDQFGLDKSRVYAMGLSGGGLMSSFLTLHRGKVIAAAAPFSGGYLHPWPKDSGTAPFVFSWGGPTDKAYEQNFDAMALTILKGFKDSGHFTIACNHGLGHKWPVEGGAYAAKFLLAHTLGGSNPFANGLGDGWPAYCKIQ